MKNLITLLVASASIAGGQIITPAPSTSGGAGKLPQLTSAGNLVLSTTAPTGNWSGLSSSLFIPDGGAHRAVFMNTAGTDGGSIFYYTAHDVYGGELQINSANRTAMCLGTNGALQLGLQVTSSTQYVFNQVRGIATAGTTTVTSIPTFFPSEYWTGSANAGAKPWCIMGVPAGGSTASSFKIYQATALPQGDGTLETKTEIGSFDADGLTLPTAAASSANSVMTRGLGDTRYKPLASYLSADHAGVTSSTTKVDSGLSIAVTAGDVYDIEMVMIFTHSAAGGIRYQGSNTGTMAVIGGFLERSDNNAVQSVTRAILTSGVDGIIQEITWGVSGTTNTYYSKIKYSCSVSGTLKIQYAQGASDATATILKAGSSIIARKL